jgi:hypothetical protein
VDEFRRRYPKRTLSDLAAFLVSLPLNGPGKSLEDEFGEGERG